jgi:putative ABC transport system permease protein
MFSEQDVRSVAKVCVIGKTVADQLFANSDPVGQTLRIRNIPFKILGVLDAKGFNLFGQDQDDTVIVPYTSHMKRLSRRTNISSILIQAASAEVIDKVQKDITEVLTQRRKGREPDFTVRNQVELAQTATATTQTMTLLLAAIASVSLLVGGIGIMNIMLVSVTERTREIGIRRAMGARQADIVVQFLIETVLLSGAGGVMGVVLGIAIPIAVQHFAGVTTVVKFWSPALAFLISVITGIAFGIYPARRAAMMNPVEALRHE